MINVCYNRGVWETCEPLEWLDNEDLTGFLKRHGYSYSADFYWGEEYSGIIDFFKHNDLGKWFCSCSLDSCDAHYFIISDFPSMLLFRKEYYDCFKIDLPEYVRCDNGDYIKRDCIKNIRISYANKKQLSKAIGWDENDNVLTIVESTAEYVSSFVKNHFNIS